MAQSVDSDTAYVPRTEAGRLAAEMITGTGYSLQQIGAVVDLSRERVRQIAERIGDTRRRNSLRHGRYFLACSVCGDTFEEPYKFAHRSRCPECRAKRIRKARRSYTCKVCGKVGEVIPWYQGKRQFCDHRCQGIWLGRKYHSKECYRRNH